MDLARLFERHNRDAFAAEIAALGPRASALGVAAWPAGAALAVLMPSFAPFNRLVGFGVLEPASEEMLDEQIERYRAAGAPLAVNVCPASRPPGLVAWLRGRGFVEGATQTVLARAPHPDPPGAAVPGLEIDAAGPDDADAWAAASKSGFESLGPEADAIARYKAEVIRARPPGSCSFLARLDGRIVGAGQAQSAAGAGTLFGGSVLPAYRGRGIQQALIAHRVRWLREMGADPCFCQVVRGGSSGRNLERQGFRVAFERHVYVLEREGRA